MKKNVVEDTKAMVMAMFGRGLYDEEKMWLDEVTKEDIAAIAANFLTMKLLTQSVALNHDELGYQRACYDETH